MSCVVFKTNGNKRLLVACIVFAIDILNFAVVGAVMSNDLDADKTYV